MPKRKTIIVTGGSQGIGSALVKAFLNRDCNVVATSRHISASKDLPSSSQLTRIDGDIGTAATATRVVETAVTQYGSVDALINNAGVFFTKPFVDYTVEETK